MIDYDQAKNIFETNKIKEELQNTKDKSVFEDQKDDELLEAIGNSKQEEDPVELQKKIEQLKLEMQADQRGE